MRFSRDCRNALAGVWSWIKFSLYETNSGPFLKWKLMNFILSCVCFCSFSFKWKKDAGVSETYSKHSPEPFKVSRLFNFRVTSSSSVLLLYSLYNGLTVKSEVEAERDLSVWWGYNKHVQMWGHRYMLLNQKLLPQYFPSSVKEKVLLKTLSWI